MSSTVRIDLPPAAWRALHSHFLDYLFSLDPVLSGALMKRLGGQISFPNLMLGILNTRVFDPHIRLDVATDAVYIGLAIPAEHNNKLFLFEFLGADFGVDAAWAEAAGKYKLEEELYDIFSDES